MKAACQMDLRLFPMDTQICPLLLESCKLNAISHHETFDFLENKRQMDYSIFYVLPFKIENNSSKRNYSPLEFAKEPKPGQACLLNLP